MQRVNGHKDGTIRKAEHIDILDFVNRLQIPLNTVSVNVKYLHPSRFCWKVAKLMRKLGCGDEFKRCRIINCNLEPGAFTVGAHSGSNIKGKHKIDSKSNCHHSLNGGAASPH